MTFKNKLFTKKHKDNISKSLKGHIVTYKTRKKISIKAKKRLSIPESNSNYGNKWTKDMKKIDSIRTKKLWKNKEWKDKVLKTQRSKKFRNKRSKITKKIWKNPIFREKIIKAIFKSWKLKPNLPEKQVIQIIELNKLPFNYTGDGKIILNGFCPDFLSKNPKHIIEIFGNYHHNLLEVKERGKRRKKTYNSLGYKLLIIWSKELENPQKVTEKIVRFWLK